MLIQIALFYISRMVNIYIRENNNNNLGIFPVNLKARIIKKK